jgi:hypothetical protein
MDLLVDRIDPALLTPLDATVAGLAIVCFYPFDPQTAHRLRSAGP